MASKKIIEPAQSEREVTFFLFGYSHSPLFREVSLTFGPGEQDLVTGEIRPTQPWRSIVVKGELYDDLMSDKPDWSPGKPAGLFRDDDLLAFALLFDQKMAKKIQDEAKKVKDQEEIVKLAMAEKAALREARLLAREAIREDKARRKAEQLVNEGIREENASLFSKAVDEEIKASIKYKSDAPGPLG